MFLKSNRKFQMTLKAAWLFLLFIYACQRVVVGNDPLLTNLLTDDDDGHLANGKQDPVPETAGGDVPQLPNQIGALALTAISVSAGLITIYNQFEQRVLPQPTTAQDTLEIVRRLEDLARPNDEEQYKHVEDTILRALNDMLSIPTGNFTELQRILWLERARFIDSDVILLLEGLLGRPVAGVDLMNNIKENLRVWLDT